VKPGFLEKPGFTGRFLSFYNKRNLNRAPMLMSTSSEFVTLCESQLALISNWGASLSVVYLTETLTEDGKGKLIPIVAYPESPREWEAAIAPKPLPSSLEVGESIPRILASEWTPRAMLHPQRFANAPATPQSDRPPATQTQEKEEKSPKQPQIVLPLIQDEIMMGLLVSARADRPWNPQEKAQLQQVARTLANACILEQRSQWLKEKFKEQKQLQSQQYDRMHSLMHQFKSPLTALGTFGKLLLKRLLPEDKNKEIANSIVRESARLRELVEQIDETIDVSEQIISLPPENWQTIEPEVEEKFDEPKLEKTSRQLLPLLPGSDFLESVSVREILEPLLVSGRAIAAEKMLDFRAEIPANLPPVRGNKKALREVLSNLIDNAIKYTPSGGSIDVKVGNSPFPNKIPIAISDTGYGIPAADLEHLFERNFRGEKANTEIPGSGLGLAIARDLIHQMQGEIEVFSPVVPQWLPNNYREKKELTNRGTTVIVWLEV
jgi:signal transduction histidine kinase